MSTLHRTLPYCLTALIALSAIPGNAQDIQDSQNASWDPLFAGYESEPAMDFGGRTLASVQSLVSRGFSSLPRIDRHPALAPAWELPLAAFLTVVQHEVDGHGGRAREFDLGPSYSFGYDFSGGTSIERAPRVHEQGILLAAGGTESDGVLAHRILLAALSPEGTDGAKIPMAMMAKLDLSLYISDVEDPARHPDRFVDQSHDGHDMAIYLVSRQAARRGFRPELVWTGDYVTDTDDPLLRSTRDDLRVTAIWNALDPSLVAAVYSYFRDHVVGGRTRVHAPVLRVSDGLALTLGTRGALGPQSVSRFLDLYGVTRRGVLTVYLRDLDSTTDRTWGLGAGIQAVKVGPGLELGVQADTWKEPDALEGVYDGGTAWNVTGELEAALGERWGLAGKVGAKSKGFLPGKPVDSGLYAGFGVTASW
jgi:hypothetical protein